MVNFNVAFDGDANTGRLEFQYNTASSTLDVQVFKDLIEKLLAPEGTLTPTTTDNGDGTTTVALTFTPTP